MGRAADSGRVGRVLFWTRQPGPSVGSAPCGDPWTSWSRCCWFLGCHDRLVFGVEAEPELGTRSLPSLHERPLPQPGFLVFIEDQELTVECYSYATLGADGQVETHAPSDIRERQLIITSGT